MYPIIELVMSLSVSTFVLLLSRYGPLIFRYIISLSTTFGTPFSDLEGPRGFGPLVGHCFSSSVSSIIFTLLPLATLFGTVFGAPLLVPNGVWPLVRPLPHSRHFYCFISFSSSPTVIVGMMSDNGVFSPISEGLVSLVGSDLISCIGVIGCEINGTCFTFSAHIMFWGCLISCRTW